MSANRGSAPPVRQHRLAPRRPATIFPRFAVCRRSASLAPRWTPRCPHRRAAHRLWATEEREESARLRAGRVCRRFVGWVAGISQAQARLGAVTVKDAAEPCERIADPRVRRERRGDAHKLTAVGGLAALSLDALSSVAYGPEAIVVALVAAGVGAISATLPIAIAIAITVLLMVLVVSYRQVIAVHPDGGGAYAVAKQDLGRGVSLLAAASLVVDYVLTVAVSLAAGAASLASVFPILAPHLLAVCLGGLVVLTGLNLVGIAESAKALMLPTLVFIVSIFAIIVLGLAHPQPVSTIGERLSQQPVEALGVILVLKAFAAGCSALTGVEAIANGVPAFRAPAVARAQRTEVTLGILLGSMLVGLAVLIKLHHVVPRGNVTVLAQLSAGAFGTGWPFYVSNLSVTLVLGLAANTSFGGLPVLMSLLARDNRLPHLFGLRAERPVFRYGVSALALLAAVLLATIGADTTRLLPLFAIGVFIGFTISQTGLVHHWYLARTPGWRRRAALNGTGALLTAVAAIVFLASKFTQGAWLLLIIIPLLLRHCCIERSAHSSWSHLPAQKPRDRARMPGLSWFYTGIVEPALLL